MGLDIILNILKIKVFILIFNLCFSEFLFCFKFFLGKFMRRLIIFIFKFGYLFFIWVDVERLCIIILCFFGCCKIFLDICILLCKIIILWFLLIYLNI